MAKSSAQWFSWGLSIVSQIPALINVIEKLKPGKPGSEKKQAVLDLVGFGDALIDSAASQDVLPDAELKEAAGKVIDAVVAFQNLVAAKKAASAAKQ